jgi:hypothetical protein
MSPHTQSSTFYLNGQSAILGARRFMRTLRSNPAEYGRHFVARLFLGEAMECTHRGGEVTNVPRWFNVALAVFAGTIVLIFAYDYYLKFFIYHDCYMPIVGWVCK